MAVEWGPRRARGQVWREINTMCGYRCCARRWRGRGLACGKRAPVRGTGCMASDDGGEHTLWGLASHLGCLETAAHRIALTKADRKRLGTCSGDRSAPRSSRSSRSTASWPSGRLPDSYQVTPIPKYLLRFTYHSWLNPAPTPVKPTFFYASLEISRGEAASYLMHLILASHVSAGSPERIRRNGARVAGDRGGHESALADRHGVQR
ncbi:hypothetical protein JB92DRAFT_13748 [Gautieria morchelliformis]|nr:hypothetical protein JB92DRAFT_13748 [Gautieria morchelliformis]